MLLRLTQVEFTAAIIPGSYGFLFYFLWRPLGRILERGTVVAKNIGRWQVFHYLGLVASLGQVIILTICPRDHLWLLKFAARICFACVWHYHALGDSEFIRTVEDIWSIFICMLEVFEIGDIVAIGYYIGRCAEWAIYFGVLVCQTASLLLATPRLVMMGRLH